jgi:hypothetical protein
MAGIFGVCNFLANLQEQSIAQFLDVRFVDGRNARSIVQNGIVEGKAGNSFDVTASDNLCGKFNLIKIVI